MRTRGSQRIGPVKVALAMFALAKFAPADANPIARALARLSCGRNAPTGAARVGLRVDF